MPKKYREAKLEYMKLVDGISSLPSRSIDCSSFVSDTFIFTIGRLYVQTYFNSNARDQVRQYSLLNEIYIHF